MKKSKTLMTLIVGLTLANNSYSSGDFDHSAGLIRNTSDSSAKTSITSTSNDGRIAPDRTSNSASTGKCRDEVPNHIGLSFLKALMPDGDLQMSRISGSTKHRLSIPAYFTGQGPKKCLNLKVGASETEAVKFNEDENARLLYLTFENESPLSFDEYLEVVGRHHPDPNKGKATARKSWAGIDKSEYESMSEEKRILACLFAQGILKKKGASYVPISNPKSSQLEVNYEKDFQPAEAEEGDITKVFLTAASPRTRKYRPAHGFVLGGLNVAVPGKAEKCLALERIDEDERLPVLYENGLIKSALHACSTGNVKTIDEMLSTLLNNVEDSEAYKLSIDLLAATRGDSLDATTESIFDELKRIGKEIKAARKGDKWLVESDEAAELAEAYAKNLEELNTQVFDSYVNELNQKMEARKHVTGSDRDELDKRIVEINEKVGELHKERDSLRIKDVERLLERFSLTGSARTIKGFFLKSEFLSKVRPKGTKYKRGKSRKRGRALSFKDADSKIERALDKYDRKLDQWELDTDARDGDYYPAKIAQREMDSIRRRQQSDQKRFQRKEQQYMKYCQASFGGFQMNPVACKRHMSPKNRGRRQQRFMRSNARHKAAYANAAQTYQRRRGYAEEARRALAEEEEDGYYYDDYYYDSYDDGDFGDFDDMYSFGGNNYAMMGGNMGNPYQGPARRNNGFQQFGGQQQQFRGPQQAVPYTNNFLGGQQQQQYQYNRYR